MNSIPMPEPTPTADPVPASDPNDQAKELAEEEFHHHLVWSERWSNPEFTDEALAKWRDEPWYESEARSEAHRFITRNAWPCFYPWGFIIFTR
ncbi:hypothetical protein N7454_005199 [Penicillium verhagenii]|nr:hypothetical protein N7454_005199 [Penicillium verhagenii]